MDIRTAMLAGAVGTIVILFGIGMFGISFGEERQTAAVDRQEATRIVLTEFPNAGILEMERDREHGQPMYEVAWVPVDEQKKNVHVNNPSGPERIIVCSACPPRRSWSLSRWIFHRASLAPFPKPCRARWPPNLVELL